MKNIERFKHEAEAVSAQVFIAPDLNSLVTSIKDVCTKRKVSGIPSNVIDVPAWSELPVLLKQEGIEIATPTIDSLNSMNLGMTVADFGVAETGTAVLIEHSADEIRAGNIPLTHLVLLRASDIYSKSSDLAPAIENRITEDVKNGKPIRVSFITGPSRTADIERTLTVGVHGPKELVIFILEDNI